MRITNTLATAATIAALSTAAFAGGPTTEVMEAPVVVEAEMAPAGSSVSSTVIIVGILAALLVAAAAAE